MKIENLIYRTYSFYQMIPVNICINDILDARILRIKRLMDFDNINVKFELLRYYPLASFALYEYFLRLTVYMLLKEEKFSELYLKFIKDRDPKGFSQITDETVEAFKEFRVSKNQLYSMFLSYNKSSHALKLVEITKNSRSNLHNITDRPDKLFSILKDKDTKEFIDWFNIMRNRFAHQSEIVDLADFIMFQNNCRNLLSVIELIKEVISFYYPDVFTHAIDPCPWLP